MLRSGEVVTSKEVFEHRGVSELYFRVSNNFGVSTTQQTKVGHCLLL